MNTWAMKMPSGLIATRQFASRRDDYFDCRRDTDNDAPSEISPGGLALQFRNAAVADDQGSVDGPVTEFSIRARVATGHRR
jgi:hypothetical protein